MPEDPRPRRADVGGLAGTDARRWNLFGSTDASRLRARGRIAALDRLAGLVARVLGAAAAQITLSGEEHSVVGAAGAGAAGAPGDPYVAGAGAVCALVFDSGAVVRIDDAAADPRLPSLDARDGSQRGSYLGVPLHVGEGVVGALCVFELSARTWTATETALLESLAESVAVELELSTLTASHEDERIIWQLAIDAGEVGAFDWDLVTGELNWDQRLLDLFGLDQESFGGSIESFDEAVHPDDRDRVSHALAEAIETVGSYAAEYRILLPSGDIRWISARGRALAGPNGRAVRLLGAASDTTAVQEQEARVARVLESMPAAFFSLDRSWRFTYANAEAKRLLGGIGKEWIGGVIWEMFPAAVGREFEREYRHAMETGEPVTFEAYYPPPLDARYEVRGWPTPDGLSVYFLDITARHEAQEALDRASRRARLLAEATASMAATWDADTAVGRLAQLVIPELGQWCVVTLTDGAASTVDWRRGLRDVSCWHVEESKRSLVERYAATRVPALNDDSFIAEALRSASSILLADDATEAIASVLSDGEARDLCYALAPNACVVVPLRARDRTLGLMTVFRDAGQPAFTNDDLDLLAELGDRAGLALDNARLYAEQRDLAGELQRSMMTSPPESDQIRLAVRYLPAAEVAKVGGDWYDSFLQPEGATVVVIGDVLGHDSAAAAAMGQLRNILRGVAAVNETPPAALLTQVDRAMSRLLIKITATFVVARFEQTLEERTAGVMRLRWSNAGHPPPIVVERPDSADTEHSADILWSRPNVLLGLSPDLARDEQVMTLRHGATLLFYTDGLVERRGELIDDGIARLAAAFTALVAAGVGLEQLCDELLRRMLADRPEDDVALVAVRVQSTPDHLSPVDGL